VTNESDSFISEVDESLRQDRVLGFLRKYGIIIGGAVVVLVLGVGAVQWWRSYQVDASRDHAEEFAEAQTLFQEGNLADAKTAFEELQGQGPRVYRAMAMMESAGVLEAEGDLAGALAGFDAAAEASRDPLMRDTARLRAAYIAAESEDFPTLRTRLEPLIASETRLSYLARELLAIEAWEAGETELARTTLENLQLAFEAPQAVQERARTALAVIGPAPEAAATDAPTAPAPSEGDTK
jgi:hypothetical protein